MVTKAAATMTKRKQTADMIESPPKRVTRARAAKPATSDHSEAKVTKITTASAKVAAAAAASKKKAASTATTAPKAPGRKVRVLKQDEETTIPTTEHSIGDPIEAEVAPKTTRGRPKKTPMTEEPEQPKSRGRPAKSVATEAETKIAATKTKGRSKKALIEADDNQMDVDLPLSKTASRTTETKRGTRNAAKSTTSTSTSTKAPATRKKVQFDEDQDKENVPIVATGPKKSALKATGMRAKPTKSTAATRATRAGRSAIVKTQVSAKEALPLSPKKVTQVAKTPSTISEDELSGDKTPIGSPVRSPAKHNTSPSKSLSHLPKPTIFSATSPAKAATTATMSSPPRRAPQSPSKDGLNSPPKKAVLDTIARPLFVNSQRLSPMKSSLLQESPRRAGLGQGSAHPVLLASKSPFKASLLSSPARRPIASPFKGSAARREGAAENATESLRVSPIKPSSSASSAPKASVATPRIVQLPIAEGPVNQAPTDQGHTDDADLIAAAAIHDQPLEDASMASSCIETDSPPKPCTSEFGTAPARLENRFPATLPSVTDMAMRRISLESQLSEDELASPDRKYAPTPLRQPLFTMQATDTPMLSTQGAAFTPLADQMNGWVASSPDKQRQPCLSRKQRGMFSLGGMFAQMDDAQAAHQEAEDEQIRVSFFEDQIAAADAEQAPPSPQKPVFNQAIEPDVENSMESQASQEYGDENTAPLESAMLRTEAEADNPTLTCTPAKVFTPEKPAQRALVEACTVSKVPLRAFSNDSPLIVPRKRSKSVGGSLAALEERALRVLNPMLANETTDVPMTPKLDAIKPPDMPSSGMKLDAETPMTMARKSINPSILQGAVVYVDVHTTEGADASGIFVDLLTQMGARCVKQWGWNPRVSSAEYLDKVTSPPERSNSPGSSMSKPGVTHVVYKDGGKRTLEKVRLSKGVVICVGVGWVLDCEREDKWLDEANYAIDTSLPPRGGGRRRKSMEPRALANLEGSLVPAIQGTPAKPSNMLSPTKEFLTFNTPVSRRDTFELDAQQITSVEADRLAHDELEAPTTPTVNVTNDYADMDGNPSYGSPTTPYFLSKGAELVQRTCPPKQNLGGLFPLSGNVDDEPDETVRHKLIAARRKSLQWASKTKSPLGSVVSYGK